MRRAIVCCLLALACLWSRQGAGAEAQTPSGELRSAVDLAIVDSSGHAVAASAIVWRGDGLLLTAAHAVVGARSIEVAPSSGRAAAELVGFDLLSDVALLRAPPEPGWAAATPSDRPPTPGEPVRAVGNPLGLGGTLTAGIVSAVERVYRPASPYGLIQHDAALNPGSSGGPLFDGAGRLIGMNVAIADGARRNVGVGFALPVAVLLRMASRLERGGQWLRPRAGLRFRDDAAVRAAIPALHEGGLPVEEVETGGPAELAGLRGGDIVVAAMERPISGLHDLALAMEPLEPEQTLRLTVKRRGDRLDLSIRLGVEAPMRGKTLPVAARQVALPHFGLILGEGDPIVARVAADSAAARAGLLPGDRLLAIGDAPVAGSAQLLAALEARPEGPLAVLVRRDARARYLVLDAASGLDARPEFGMNDEAPGSEAF